MISDKKDLLLFERPLPTIAIIDPENSTIDQVLTKIIDQQQFHPINKIFFKSLTECLEKLNQLKDNREGLIDLKWIKEITTEKPSCIIYINYQKGSFTPKEEGQLYSELSKIKEKDKNIEIILFIITKTNPQPFEIEDRENPNNLKNLAHVYIGNSNDIFRFRDYKNALVPLFEYYRKYYKKLKDELKGSLKQKGLKKEERVRIDIKLGYLSMLKKKKDKLKSKYFEDAYNILIAKEFNVGLYYYGENNNNILNYFQIRAAADWLLFKIVKINENLNKNDIELINKFNKHLDTLTMDKFFPKDNPERKQILFLIDCYWKYKKLETFIQVLEENNLKNAKSIEACVSYYLKQIYSIIRINKYIINLNDKQLTNVKIEDKEIPLDKIITAKTYFYEKLPEFEFLIDPLNRKSLKFNEEILLKKILYEFKMNPDLIRNSLYHKVINLFEKIKKDTKGLDLYLNYINLLNDSFLNNIQFMNLDLKCIFSICVEMSKNIIKFPKIYYTYLCKYNDFLISKYNAGEISRYIDKLLIYNNLIKIGNQRVLTEEEEILFFKLFKDEDLMCFKSSNNSDTTNTNDNIQNEEVKEIINVNSMNNEIFNNNLFSFDYQIIGGNDNSRKVLELVEYKFTLSTCLSKENMKFNYLELIFANNKRCKKFTTFPNELNKDSPVYLDYKLFLKSNENNLLIEKILFSFENAPRIKYEILVHSSKDKIIMLEQISKKVLDFKIPKVARIGEGEYYNFECEVVKEPSYEVEIGQLCISFYLENKQNTFSGVNRSNTVFNKTLKPTSMAATFEKMAQKNQENNQKNNNNNNPLASTVITKSSTSMSNFFKNETSQSTITNSNSLSQTLSNLSNKSNANKQNTNDTTTNRDNTNCITPEPKKKRDPEFFSLLDDGNISEPLNRFIFKVDNFEELYKKGNNKINFLVQFKDKGLYTLNYNALYTIVKKEIDDDSIELDDKGKVNFEVVSPFTYKFDDYCPTNMMIDNIKKYDTNKEIMIRMNLTNELSNDIIIKNISTINENEEIKSEISTPLSTVFELDDEPLKQSLLTILKSSEYIIPFNCIFKNEINKKSFGKLSIDWSTEKLQKFSNKIWNNNSFTFPEIIVEPFSFDLSYSIGNFDKDNNNVPMTISIFNRSNIAKRIEIDVEQLQFLVQGDIQKKFLIMPQEKKEICITLFPALYGILKLPNFKVREFDTSGNKKLYSIYNFCQNLNIEL